MTRLYWPTSPSMSIRVHNTLTRRKEPLEPLEPGRIRLFVCGPTVYDFAHLGHAKTYTQFDFIARYLRFRGYEVTYLQNVTDIDDKIIDRAAQRSVGVSQLAREFEANYREDMEALGNTSVDEYARATEFISEIVSQVRRLLAAGHAYELPDGYYYDIATFADYGKLSGRRELAPADAVSRVDENPLKRSPGDFALWKRPKGDEPVWETEIGPGRPGWHIEDTAITERFFGPQYDIHGGAVDLIFPHHEAEVAVMEAISGRAPLARYWLHTGFLNLSDVKMSKSLGNVLTIRDLLARTESRLLRFFLLSNHYRSQIEFTDDSLENARGALRRIDNFYLRLDDDGDAGASEVADTRHAIIEALDDDFDTPAAFARLFEFIREQHRGSIPAAGSRALLEEIDGYLGILDRGQSRVARPDAWVHAQIAEREALRHEKRFAEADAIRDRLKDAGIVLEDTPGGVRWHRLGEAART